MLLKRFICGLAAVLVALVSWAGQAGAHVTVSPSSLPQGTDDAVLAFRVPNESTTASVVGLRIEFPLDHPIVLVNPEAGSGWQATIRMTALPRPITTDDGTFTSTVSEIDWSGSSIPLGQFGEFNVLAQGIPTGATQLVFKAIQSYSDGTTVSWIQVPNRAVPDPPHPAPIITLTAPGKASVQTAPEPATNPGGNPTGSGSGSNAASVAALILAAFAVVVALLAVWLGRPRLGAGDATD